MDAARMNSMTRRSAIVHAVDASKPKKGDGVLHLNHPTLCGWYVWHGSIPTSRPVTCKRCLRILATNEKVG